MYRIKSGIENPSKSEVIGRCGGDENRMTTQNRKSKAKKNKKTFLNLKVLFIASISPGLTTYQTAEL